MYVLVAILIAVGETFALAVRLFISRKAPAKYRTADKSAATPEIVATLTLATLQRSGREQSETLDKHVMAQISARSLHEKA
jgi:hypothetical protein